MLKKYLELYHQTFTALKENPTICLLFILLGVLDLAALTVLFFSPSEPLSIVIAPIIRTFWGERFLHYPDNFLLLPKLYNHAHFLILSAVGIVITGIAIKKIEAYTKGDSLSTASATLPVLQRYFSILLAWLFSYGSFTFLLKHALRRLPPDLWFQLAAGFLIGLLLQSFFAFLLPVVVLANERFLKNFRQGILLGAKHILFTSTVLLLPMALVVGISYLKALSPVFVRTYPEGVIWILAGGIIVSMLVDLFVTSSTTLLFLKVRK